MLEVLTKQQTDQKEAGLIRPWVFTSQAGGPLEGVNVTHRFQAALDHNGLARLRWHDLRRATAIMMKEQGLDDHAVKDQLGHSQISLTVNTYSHVTAMLRQRNAQALQQAAIQK
ncbi:MAG: tyrosine-type recombinase/integrase [Dehalococcoidia bacterium]